LIVWTLAVQNNVYARLRFRSIYIAKTKVALSRSWSFPLPVHLFRHGKIDTGNYTFAPRIARILMCRYCFHVNQWMFVANSLCIRCVSTTSWWRPSWNRSAVVCPSFLLVFMNCL